jgi:Cu(I)/Ag(I) efflux system membrane fusion protein
MRRILKGSLSFMVIVALFLACNQSKDGSTPIVFTCPMHPDVLNEGPGICPICKMDLVPKDSDVSHGSADK